MGPSSFLEGGPIMYRSCPSVCLSVPCLLLFTYRLRYVNLNSYGKWEIPIVKTLQGWPHSGQPLNGCALLLYLVWDFASLPLTSQLFTTSGITSVLFATGAGDSRLPEREWLWKRRLRFAGGVVDRDRALCRHRHTDIKNNARKSE